MERKDEGEVRWAESETAEGTCEKIEHETLDDAGEVEIELPAALKDLLDRLNERLSSDGKAVEEVPWLESEEYGGYFTEGGCESPQRTEVRLKVLRALGNCRTLRIFNTRRLRDWKLSVPEWEVLLVGLQTNASLEEILTYPLESAETEALIGPFWQDLFRQVENLNSLRVFNGMRGEFATKVGLGLRANSHNKLKDLSFVWFTPRGDCLVPSCIPYALIISSAPHLESLLLRGQIRPMDAGEIEALANALRHSRNLKTIHILRDLGFDYKALWSVGDALVDAYSGLPSNPVLECLSLEGDVGITAEHLAHLIRGNIRKIQITRPHILFQSDPCLLFPSEPRSFHPFTPDEWESVGRSFRHAQVLEYMSIFINIRDTWLTKESADLSTCLAELWKASNKSPLLQIQCSCFLVSTMLEKRLEFLQKALSDTYLKDINLSFEAEGVKLLTSVVDSLASNTSVQSLSILLPGESTEEWRYFFHHLRDNSSIRKLRISSRSMEVHDDNFRDLMDLLEINFTLEEIDVRKTPWEVDGKRALIEEAVGRNKRRAGYFSILSRAGLSFAGAKAGRVFLCGLPFAGKTQMKITMMKTLSKQSKSPSIDSIIKEKLGKLIPVMQLLRTKGIEVEVLCDDESQIISIWDLAGQQFFRALHYHLFPKLSQACIFIFVFNPFQNKSKSLKQKMYEAFRQELQSWLRFVVSNTQITGRILPQMLVIVTHKDKVIKYDPKFDLTFMQDIVEKLQKEYKDVIDLCPRRNGVDDKSNLIYHVNAKDEKAVRSIKDLVLSCMKDILEKKSPRVPNVCSELVSILLQGSKEIHCSPLWTLEQFYKFCSTRNDKLQNFKPVDEGGRRVLHAVASYMHDAGVICMTRSAIMDFSDSCIEDSTKSIIVDLNWLTQDVLGELISYSHQLDIHSVVSKSYRNDEIDGDGFIYHDKLNELIKNILTKKKCAIWENSKRVRELLFELDLCYNIESKDGIKRCFMPVLFGAKVESMPKAMNELDWGVDIKEGWENFGFRVQCSDTKRTAFSPGFYTRYQIHLRKEMEVLGVNDGNFKFSRYHVQIKYNGCIIFVEIDESVENHVDIMVQFSKRITRDSAMDWIQQHVVKSLIKFCSSAEGCPGIVLVVSILRTECVKRLTPRLLRTEAQTVKIEELKVQFQNDIARKLGRGEVQTDSLFGYLHTWPDIAQVGLPAHFEKAQTLLSSKDVDDVLVAVQKHHEDLCQNLCELRQISQRLREFDEAEITECHQNSYARAKPDFKEALVTSERNLDPLALVVSRPSFMTTHNFTIAEKLTLLGLYDVRNKLDHLKDQMTISFKQIRNDLKHFKSSLDDMHLEMCHITSKLDTIMQYNRSKESHKTPSRPYFRLEGVSGIQKAKAVLFRGKAVRLHLMCEARHRPHEHVIENQPGLELCFEKENKLSKSIRKLSVISLKMIWVLLQIGAQVAAGAGNMIPDISNLDTGISIGLSAAVGASSTATNIVLDELEQQMKASLSLMEDKRAIDDAWICLKNYLAENLTTEKCASLFKLHLVTYINGDDPYAWLCESCISSGKQNFLLESC